MKREEQRERAKNSIMLAGLKLFGTKGYSGTSVSMLEEETGFTRGSFFVHYKNMKAVFEETVNKFYLGRVTSCSVPNEYRSTLKVFYTKLVSMLEEECIEMIKNDVRHISKAYFILEQEALLHISDFKQKYEDAMQYQLMVWENVMYKAKESGEIPEDVPVKETASLFFTTILGHAVDSSIKEKLCYTDGLMEKLNNLYRLIVNRKEVQTA